MNHIKTFESFSSVKVNEEISSLIRSREAKVKNAQEFFSKNINKYPTNAAEFKKYLEFFNQNKDSNDACGKAKIKMLDKIINHVYDNEEAKFQLPIKFDAITADNCGELSLNKTASYSSGAGVGGDSGHKK